ncbi:hypothetical protein SAMN02745229_02553 [Butyrivibrio fibrisolvens DSM 3071]|uniref:Uncharacterized protein n=1 Tax=Butyrivibrio fibrisolvens DSM 3071 TaxID=1121131 RepID=A0A1M5ZQ16_BUTFI|nr:hypothetical protein [Butyrivibrio fibrisolvens]SHI26302.1 hypothetical protein SAMN02745229_02553 [Butyrivibrio fibrisolvens DSM 3071]
MALTTSAIAIDTIGVDETATATGKVAESISEVSEKGWQAIESLANDAIAGNSSTQLSATGSEFTNDIKTLVGYAQSLMQAISKTGLEFTAVDEAGSRAAQGK